MPIVSTAVTVTTTAAKVAGVTVTAGAIRAGSVILANLGASTVYVGGSNVTTANGFPVDPGANCTMEFKDGEDLYAVTASGTVSCRTLQVGGN